MSTQSVVFLFVLVLAASFFSYSVQRLYRFLRLGRDEARLDHPARRLWNVLTIAIAQRKILRDPVAGPLHATVFWGFIVLTAGSIEILASGVFPHFSYSRILPAPVYAGDTLRSETEVLAKRESRSRPGSGIVTVRTRGLNQRDEVVIEFERSIMLRIEPDADRD